MDWLEARDRECDELCRALATISVDVDALSAEQVVQRILERGGLVAVA